MSEIDLLLPDTTNTELCEERAGLDWAEACSMLTMLEDSEILFDVDATIYDERTDSLRSGVRESFEQLTQQGNRIHIWSLLGDERAGKITANHGLSDLVTSVNVKIFGESARNTLSRLGFMPTITVDNEPLDRIEGIAILHVKSFLPRLNWQ